MRELRIIEVKSEIGAGTRGARLGSAALRTVSFEKGHSFFKDTESVDVKTFNDELHVIEEKSPAKYSNAVLKTCSNVSETVGDCLKDGKFPFVIAGDHSSAAGTIFGIKSANPEKRLGVIWIDAHPDLQTPYTSESGNMHGMPLAMVTGTDNQHLSVNEVPENIVNSWEEIKQLAGGKPAINLNDIVFVGARDIDKAEASTIQSHGIKNYTVSEVRQTNVESVCKKILQDLNDCDIIYISFDVDSLDPSVSEGTGTPVPDGFMPDEAQGILLGLLSSKKIVAVEFVEINPTLDVKNKMAKTVFPIVISAGEALKKSN